jgi:cysteine dioxygenase
MQSLEDLHNSLKSNITNIRYVSDFYRFLESYTAEDWLDLVDFSHESYNRITIFAGKSFELLLLCWEQGQSSEVHNHPSQGCIFKLLKGQLEEQKYNNNLELTATNTINVGGISYMHDSLGLHKVSNQGAGPAISLHIYAPGNYIRKSYQP